MNCSRRRQSFLGRQAARTTELLVIVVDRERYPRQHARFAMLLTKARARRRNNIRQCESQLALHLDEEL